MSEYNNDVSKIHKRYSLTLINPSSFYYSLVISVILSSIIVLVTGFFYLENYNLVYHIFAVIAVLLVTQYIDSRLTKKKEYSKSLHLSLFGNALWLLVIFVGFLSNIILNRAELSLIIITEGMFLFASFRIGLLTSVFGASLRKAWLVCFIQPMAMYLALLPFDLWVQSLFDIQALIYGGIFLIVASVWSVLTDRAGRPGVKSTHQLVQAYLASLSEDEPSEVERLLSERSKSSIVSTSQIRICSKNQQSDFRIVLPGIHPGPFHPVGGSNIPYLIYKNMNSSAMVMHSISNHSLNLPSKHEVETYLQDLTKSSIFSKGQNCTEPTTVQINKARVVGILFDKIALLFLSLSPHGMEDIPLQIRNEIEQFSKNRSFERILIVDCHNAMGEEISSNDSEDLLTAAKSCLDNLMTKETYPLEFGYANSKHMGIDVPDLALGGIGVLCLQLNNKKYFLGWADANNMENGVREYVVKQLSNKGYNLIEICTSDSHFTRTDVRTKMGYYQFGKVTESIQVSNWFLEIAKLAEKNIDDGSFEILENESKVKIMGPTIFRDYSQAVDNTLKITKVFSIGCLAFFIVTMFL
jgi:putative membrane protein